MRVAIVAETFLPDVNGVSTTVCRVLEHLESEGHAALLLAPRRAPPRYAGAEIMSLRGVTFPLYPSLRLTPPQPGILPHLRRFQPDLIHLVGPILVGALGPALGRRLAVPVVSSYHTNLAAYTGFYGFGWLDRPMTAYLRWIHNQCAVTLCPSTATLTALARQGFLRLARWGRGVDTARFSPEHRSAAWRELVGAGPDDVVVLYVGRLAAEKRLDVLARAICTLSEDSRRSVRFILVGDGPARPSLERQLRGRPVTFTGFRRGHDLAVAYASADLFVFPSDTDTFGQVIQEAMASSLPVVGARAGGTLDLIHDGQTGLLFEPGNPDDLRTQLDRFIASRDLRFVCGTAGYRAAQDRSWRRVAGELVGYYRQALDNYPSADPTTPRPGAGEEPLPGDGAAFARTPRRAK